MPTPKRILGIDPGSRIVGYGVVEMEQDRRGPDGLRYVECGVIKAVTGADFAVRLCEIATGLREVVAELEPDEAAVESVFQKEHAQSALKLGHARGVALLCAAEAVDLQLLEDPVVDEDPAGPDDPGRARRLEWAELMRRTSGADVLECPRCGGRMRLIALVRDPDVAEKILRYVGLWSRGPPQRRPVPLPN